MRNIRNHLLKKRDMRNPSVTTPCCSKVGLKRGPWTPEEDEILANYIRREGEGRWRTLPKRAGLLRCGKSCRLRWVNYLSPSLKRERIAPDEEDLILRLHRLLGNRWALIAGRIPGRTDNEIKNYWNTHLSKKLISQGIDPRTHKPLNDNTTNPPRIINPTPAVSISSNSNTIPNPNEDSKSLRETVGSSPALMIDRTDTNLEPFDADNHDVEGLIKELQTDQNGEGNAEEYHNMGNRNDDMAFSSILDCMVNENMMNPLASSPALHAFNLHDALWEADILSQWL